MRQQCFLQGSDGQTTVFFNMMCCNGPGCLLMMVHTVSDGVNSQWMAEEDLLLRSYAVQLL